MGLRVLGNGGNITGGFSRQGGMMTGPLILARDPLLPLEAVTKNYSDLISSTLSGNNFTTGVLPVGRLPAFTGDATSVAGSNSLTLLSNITAPGTYTKVTVNQKGLVTTGSTLVEADIPNLDWSRVSIGRPTTAAGYGITDGVLLSGGAIAGPLTLHAAPVDALHASTKQYADSLVASTQSGSFNTGDIITLSSSVTPSGFLRTNGGQVSRTTFSALFSVIGSSFEMGSIPGKGQPWRQQFDISLEPNTVLGAWSTAGNLPSGLYHSTVIVTRNRVFLLGGSNGTALISTIFTAPINADGTLGAWTTAGNLPVAISNSTTIVTRNRVFLLGGTIGGVQISTIHTTTINSDGTLGVWTTAGNLSSVLHGSSVIVTRNRVFLLGGSSGGAISTIHTATINAGLNDYSPFYDGTIVLLTTDPANFRLPDTTLTDPPFAFSFIKT